MLIVRRHNCILTQPAPKLLLVGPARGLAIVLLFVVVLLCAVLNVLVLSGFLIRVLLILVLAVRWAQSWALMHQAHLVLNVDRVHGGSHRTVVQGVATSHVVSLLVLI